MDQMNGADAHHLVPVAFCLSRPRREYGGGSGAQPSSASRMARFSCDAVR
jgi:hypothetical protein